MLGSNRQLCFPEQLRVSPLCPSDSFPNGIQVLQHTRKEKKNHTNKLQELSLMIPINLPTRNKKLTKKEILLHILHYIQFLQRSINVAKTLVKLQTSDGGLGRNLSANPARCTPSSSSCLRNHTSGAYQKPQKRKFTRISEHPTNSQKTLPFLTLDQSENLTTTSPGQDEGHGGADSPSKYLYPNNHTRAASSSHLGDGEEVSQLTVLCVEESTFTFVADNSFAAEALLDEPDVDDTEDIEVQKRTMRSYFLSKAQPCFSNEVDKEVPDADPWLPAWTSEDNLNESLPRSFKTSAWGMTEHPGKILGLSSSLFSSPSKILPDHILKDNSYFLTEGLFEEVFLEAESVPAACEQEGPQEKNKSCKVPVDPPDSQSAVSLDHCYPSVSENDKVASSSSSESTDTESSWEQEEDNQTNPEDQQSSSDEDRDYTWTPTRRSSSLPAPSRKTKKSQTSKGPVKPKDIKKASCPSQVKKKCVNGFIMFCRMNRKQYIRACPGTASTAATKELAQLWRVMTSEERRPYCTKARRFSRQHNRIVKQDHSSSEDEGDDCESPKSFQQLLAEKAPVASLDMAPLLAPHFQ